MRKRGHRVRHAMKARGIHKQFALAIDLGIDQSTLSRWSNGATLSVENAIKLSMALDVSLDWLLLGRGHMEQHKQRKLSHSEWRLIRQLRWLPDEIRKSVSHHILTLSGNFELNPQNIDTPSQKNNDQLSTGDCVKPY